MEWSADRQPEPMRCAWAEALCPLLIGDRLGLPHTTTGSRSGVDSGEPHGTMVSTKAFVDEATLLHQLNGEATIDFD